MYPYVVHEDFRMNFFYKTIEFCFVFWYRDWSTSKLLFISDHQYDDLGMELILHCKVENQLEEKYKDILGRLIWIHRHISTFFNNTIVEVSRKSLPI